jgi:BirA family biotin operon repressor/biotin-[acetyl-CoA-carboxylase] ligase
MDELAKIKAVIADLKQHKKISEEYWVKHIALPYSALRLTLRHGFLVWPDDLDLLNSAIIDQLLAGSPKPYVIDVHQCVESTNTLLVDAAQSEKIDSRIHVAEFQYQGRGRRGRQWLSPYARNLAVSLGRASQRELSDLGGLSLVVGIALVEALEAAGVKGISLKWPNDVWVENKKLAGILIELVSSAHGTQIIIGFGVNIDLTDAQIASVDQAVTDIKRCGGVGTRNELVAECIKSVTKYLDFFELNGFADLVPAFNALHTLHETQCSVISPGEKPNRSVKVIGVGESGELIVESMTGIELIHGGEISIRPT